MRRVALLVLAAALGLALFADFLAADRPIVLRLRGTTYWFPNLVQYEALRGRSGTELAEEMTRADWAIWAPVRHGPISVRGSGELLLLAPPGGEHWLGTDDRGRDVLARLIHGTRATAIMALGVALLSLLLAIGLGVLAVSRGGALDAAVVTACDVVSAFPALLVVVAAQGLLGAGGILAAILLIAIPRAADGARLARGAMAGALARPFADAARALGAGRTRLVLRHALPHAAPQLRVATALTAATAVLAEAALSFLGFGTPPPSASWGELLAQAHQNGLRWWLVLPPGLCIAAVAAALGALAQPRRTAARRGGDQPL